MKTKNLLLIIGGLLGAYLLYRWYQQKQTNDFVNSWSDAYLQGLDSNTPDQKSAAMSAQWDRLWSNYYLSGGN